MTESNTFQYVSNRIKPYHVSLPKACPAVGPQNCGVRSIRPRSGLYLLRDLLKEHGRQLFVVESKVANTEFLLRFRVHSLFSFSWQIYRLDAVERFDAARAVSLAAEQFSSL